MHLHPARRSGTRSVSVAALVARFAAAGIAITAVLAALIALLARQAGTEQAIQSAEEVAWISATGIVEPLLTDGLVRGDSTALARTHAAMREDVLRGSLVRVKVWTTDGRIVYADDSRLIGRSFDLDEEELQVVTERGADSAISDLDDPENVYERPFEKLLEVYVGVRSPSGRPLLFEAYFEYEAVVQAGQAQWRHYAPPVIAGLVLLQLVQIPMAWSLARRLQRQQLERSRLLRHAADASGAERRRIAADLHDGTVQDLAGLAFALDAARLGSPDQERDRRLLGEVASQLRACVGELRSLLVDIYPPDLAEEGLPGALHELAAGIERTGIRVELAIDESAVDLPLVCAEVMFRSAQEALRNVGTHSGAEAVSLELAVTEDRVLLVIDDDGYGFEEERLAERLAEGHVGLRSLGDLVADAGGDLSVRSAPGQGTRIAVSMPLEPTSRRVGSGRKPDGEHAMSAR